MKRSKPFDVRLAVLYTIKRAQAHYWGTRGLVYSVHDEIFILRDLADPRPESLGSIPWRPLAFLGRPRLLDRALKTSILQVHDLGQGALLAGNAQAWWMITPHAPAELLSGFPKTRPMNRGLCTSGQGLTYIADYFDNRDRQRAVRIHRMDRAGHFEVAWEFPPREVRHVHALIPDPEDEGRIWVLTGDGDQESRILFTDDQFRSLRVFRQDGQRTRAVDLIIREGMLFWGMDSPETTSFILATSKSGPGEIRTLQELPGPAYYATRNEAGGIYWGTTAEPGPSVRDRAGHVFGSLRDGNWSEVWRRWKDPFPQHGIFYLPRGVLPGNFLVFSQRALFPHEGRMTVARDLAWASD